MFHTLYGSFVLPHVCLCAKNIVFLLYLLFVPGEMRRMVGQDSGDLYSSSDSAIPAGKPWANHLTFLSPSFLLYKMGIITTALRSHKVVEGQTVRLVW